MQSNKLHRAVASHFFQSVHAKNLDLSKASEQQPEDMQDILDD